MNIRRLFLFTFHFSLFTSTVFAQMDNVVEVENTYAPVLRDADKINILPPAQTPVIHHHLVEYDNTLQPPKQYTFQPMQAARSDAADTGAPRGFLTLGGGNAGNVNLRGSYGLKLTDADLLDFDVSLRGFCAKVQDAWNNDERYLSRFYSTRGAVRYEHVFSPLSSLLADAEAGSQVFNGQHNTLMGFNARLTPYALGDFRLGGSAGFEFFGQKYLTNAYISTKKNREAHFTGSINAAYDMGDGHTLGIDLSADFLAYAYNLFTNNNTFDIHPYYRYATDEFQLTLGTHLDFFTGVESKFRAAPDVSLRYHATDALTLFGQAGGGTVRNDYRHFTQMTPYWRFTPSFLSPQYTPQLAHQYDYVRAAAGVEWNIATGLFARLYGGFDKSQNRAELLAVSTLIDASGWHAYAHLDLRYDYKDVVTWRLNGQYNAWKSHYGNNDDAHAEATAWRPIVDLRTDISYRPVRRLRLAADYTLQTFSSRSSLPYSRPTTHDIGTTITYQLPISQLENHGGLLTAYVRGDNLLNRHYDLYPGVRTPGINFLAGLTLTF